MSQTLSSAAVVVGALRLNCNFFLMTSVKTCFGCSKQPSDPDSSTEHPKHIHGRGTANRQNILKCLLHIF